MDILLIILTFIITLGAQAYITSSYKRTRKINTKGGLSGREIARKILDSNGLKNVDVVEIQGQLTDHYDPSGKVVRLSSDIYSGSSIASVSVAAHECGHAIQDKNGYLFLKIRRSIVPLVNLASSAGMIAIMAGFIFQMVNLIWLGIIAELIILGFQVITLPVEFNASRRALKQLKELKLVEAKEQSECRSMLTAAALTYVAAVATALIEIVRLLLIMRSSDD